MIGIVAHSEKADARAATRRMVDELLRRREEVLLESATAALIGEVSGVEVGAVAARCDLLVVLGGDGTILRVLNRVPGPLPSIFGINIGSLGFLTCVGPREIELAAESIARRDFLLSERTLLAATIRSASGERTFRGLNDVVVSRGERSKLVKIRVCIDGVPLTEYNADGLIVATPTGSTAYSLAAGGPILMPDSGAFVVTPVCPHVLTNRTTVVSDASVVQARLTVPGQEVFVTVDGQESEEIGMDDVLEVSKSPHTLPLAMLRDRSFSEVLRQKLKWSGSNV
jgi:NAD+ kinase